MNEWERRLSRQGERNTHKQRRADNEEMKGKGGAGLRANDGKDFKAPGLTQHPRRPENSETENRNKKKVRGRERGYDTAMVYMKTNSFI